MILFPRNKAGYANTMLLPLNDLTKRLPNKLLLKP